MRRSLLLLMLLLNSPIFLPHIGAQPGGAGTGDIPEYATGFSIDATEAGGVLTVHEPWPGGAPIRYLLIPRDEGASSRGIAMEEYEAVIETPIRSIVTLSTTYLPHLASLGLLDTLAAVDRESYVYTDQVRRLLERGSVLEVGNSDALDVERLLAIDPDLVMTSALGPEDPVITALERADIPVVINADWLETSPLGRAEWIRFVAALYDAEDEAEELFQGVTRRYREARRLLAAAQERPTVLLNAPYRGEWAVPAGDSYMAQLVADAGGEYLWSDTEGTGSIFLDLEEVFAVAGEAEYWLNLGFRWRRRADVARSDTRLTQFAAYRSGAMYHYNRRVREDGANDFWESGAGRPDILLRDIGRILHPELMEDHDLYYYRKLR